MKEALKLWDPVALIALLAVIVMLRVIAPPPPKSIAFAAGASDGIEALQKETGQLNVPVSYNEELFQLRSHINFVEALITRQGVKAG